MRRKKRRKRAQAVTTQMEKETRAPIADASIGTVLCLHMHLLEAFRAPERLNQSVCR